MANSLDIQITQEGPRNAVVKLTGYLDSGDVIEQSAIALSDFTNNDQNLYLSGFRVDTIEWSMSTGLEIMLAWNSNQPKQIYPIAGRGRIVAKNYGGFTPDNTRKGYDGSINLSTVGASSGTFVSGQVANFTVVLELVKLYSTTFKANYGA